MVRAGSIGRARVGGSGACNAVGEGDELDEEEVEGGGAEEVGRRVGVVVRGSDRFERHDGCGLLCMCVHDGSYRREQQSEETIVVSVVALGSKAG